MRSSLFTSVGALLATTGLATAQPPAPGPLPPPATAGVAAEPSVLPIPAPAAMPPVPAAAGAAVPQSPVAAWQGVPPGWSPGAPISDLAQWYNIPMHGPQAWFGVEYLMWWMRPGPLSVPLVNTTRTPVDLATAVNTGSIVDPNAATILGNQRIYFGTSSGVRATVGRWLDSCQELGVEANFFIFPERSRSITLTGGGGQNAQPALTVPFNSVGGAFLGETTTTIAGPFAGTTVLGTVNLRMSNELWGGDVDGLLNLCKGEFWRVDGIGGFKFLALDEDLRFSTTLTSAPFGSTVDQFTNRNRFYGGEFGLRLTSHSEKWGMESTTKLGMGDTVRESVIRGSSVLPNNLGGGNGVGGLFALSSNIGSRTTDRFSVVPQVNGKVTYDWTCHFRTSVGYNFLYWTEVNRPGNQIDRNINVNLAPVFGGAPGGAGVAAPRRLDHDTDFTAHGVSFGTEFTW